MPSFVAQFGQLDPLLQGVVVSIILVPSALTGFLGGNVADLISRKWTISLGCAVFAVGSAVSAASFTLGQLIAGRCVAGVGEGLFLSAAGVYLYVASVRLSPAVMWLIGRIMCRCEISPKHLRGRLMLTNQLFNTGQSVFSVTPERTLRLTLLGHTMANRGDRGWFLHLLRHHQDPKLVLVPSTFHPSDLFRYCRRRRGTISPLLPTVAPHARKARRGRTRARLPRRPEKHRRAQRVASIRVCRRRRYPRFSERRFQGDLEKRREEANFSRHFPERFSTALGHVSLPHAGSVLRFLELNSPLSILQRFRPLLRAAAIPASGAGCEYFEFPRVGRDGNLAHMLLSRRPVLHQPVCIGILLGQVKTHLIDAVARTAGSEGERSGSSEAPRRQRRTS